jgi:FkbM family methyltransferase
MKSKSDGGGRYCKSRSFRLRIIGTGLLLLALFNLRREVVSVAVVTKSLVHALNTMIATLRESYPMEIDRACANPTIVRGKKCLESSILPRVNTPHKIVDFVPKEGETFVPVEEGLKVEEPLPPWISTDPVLRQQEERQFLWESNQRKQVDSDAYRRVRSEFHQKLLENANSMENQALQEKAGALLKEGLISFAQPGYDPTDKQADPVFDDIIVAVNFDHELMQPGDGTGQSKKALVGERLFQQLDGTCVVYGAGIAYETGFEADMARRFGCTVHAFDCTMDNKQELKAYIERQNDLSNLAFHPWCVGEEKEILQDELKKSRVYALGDMAQNMVQLDTIMERLGHEELDILKFDIEGFEWNLFDSILKSKKLPRQIAFELHARHANAGYVPPYLVAEKGREAVVELFDRLYKLGYRVVSKELNHGDFRCAEFVVYRFHEAVKI